jgi:nucleotide-binding universal stress UspA family protein
MTETLSITVGVDAEDASRVAVAWAVATARSLPARLTLLSAFDMLLVAPVDEEERVQGEARRVERLLPGTPVEPVVVEGSIHETLRTYSEHSDLLVIGSHRSRRWRSVLSGNLPARMAGISGCPIVVVPDDWRPRPGRIVVGLAEDGSSEAALGWAAEFAVATGRELEILHAWMRPDPPSDPVSLYLGTPAEWEPAHREHLAAAAARVRGLQPGLTVVETLVEAPAARALADSGRTAELLVIGSHRRGPVAGLFFGSVAQDLVRSADTALCVVPAEPAVPGLHRLAARSGTP